MPNGNGGFERWAKGFSGCDGGDLGSPQQRAIWLCGIEWGGGHSPQALMTHMQEDVSCPPAGYANWKESIRWIFNWRAMKLLAAIHGQNVKQYKSFAEGVKPFVIGSPGFFKMNLYPVSFRNTSASNWEKGLSEVTGMETKGKYLDWCRAERFPSIRCWTQLHQPKIVICLGKTYEQDFLHAFHDKEAPLQVETIDDRELRWGRNEEGVLLVVLPFMVNRNGLVRDTSVQKFGKRIAQLVD